MMIAMIVILVVGLLWYSARSEAKLTSRLARRFMAQDKASRKYMRDLRWEYLNWPKKLTPSPPERYWQALDDARNKGEL